MNFLSKLMQDAQPKAEQITNKTKQIAQRIANANAVQRSGQLAYKGLVNTVGIAMVMSKPVVVKVGSLFADATKETK